MRLLVCGDRNWVDFEAVKRRIAELKPSVVIHGCARGADSLAEKAASEMGIPVLSFPADWVRFGKKAGYIRNGRMLYESKPDHVLVFHDDIEHSEGTADMVRRAKQAGITVETCRHNRYMQGYQELGGGG